MLAAISKDLLDVRGNLILPTCSPERCRQEAPSSTHWPRGPGGSCRHGWGGSGHSSSPAGLGRAMGRKGKEGVDEVAMLHSVGSWCGQARGAKKTLGRKGKPEESDLLSFACLLLMGREMES